MLIMKISTKKTSNISHEKMKALKSACLKSAENRSKRRVDILSKYESIGLLDIGNSVSKRDLLFLGIGLYWGEGYKNGNGEFGFTNSDPEMIKVFLKIIKEIYNIENDQLVLKININELFIDKLLEIEEYWQTVTKIDKTQFTKTTVIKSKLNKKYNIDGYKGTLRIKVKKGEFLKKRILSSIKQIHQTIATT